MLTASSDASLIVVSPGTYLCQISHLLTGISISAPGSWVSEASLSRISHFGLADRKYYMTHHTRLEKVLCRWFRCVSLFGEENKGVFQHAFPVSHRRLTHGSENCAD